MGSNDPKTFSLSLTGWGFWLSALASALLMSWLGLGWLVTTLLIALLAFLALPIVAVLVFRWWAQRLISTDSCPVCGFDSQAIEGHRFNCPSCGEPLFVADGYFYRQTPPGTIEIELLDD